MKLQACMFRRNSKPKIGPWETGVAVVGSFDNTSVEYIIDAEGRKLRGEPYDWALGSGPLSYLDTEYRSNA